MIPLAAQSTGTVTLQAQHGAPCAQGGSHFFESEFAVPGGHRSFFSPFAPAFVPPTVGNRG
ncbi:MAG TPA: hypothetical protein VJ598_03775, partial [Albitalea sp.]|nr:hypothetical protein [Albitalea sp.]